MHQCNIDTLEHKLYNLQKEAHQLEEFVARFKKSNKRHLKIKSIAEEIVNGLLKDQGALITSAITAVVQALRMNPHRYDIIFGGANGNGHGGIDGIVHSSSSSITYQNHYSNEYFQALEEVAKQFLNILTT